MGDRCKMKITCFDVDSMKFAELGFQFEDTVETIHPLGHAKSVISMFDEERTPDMDEMPKGVPYFGWHGDGACYPGHIFASDGERYYEVIDVADVGMCVPIDSIGYVQMTEIINVQKYIACLKRVKQIFGIKE